MNSNPFRKSRPEDRVLALDKLDTSPAPTPPPPVSFRTPAPPPPPPAPAESPLPPALSTASSQKKKSKVVKKVRVLSPPPQSPDTPAWPFNAPVQQQQQPQQEEQQHPAGDLQDGYGFPSIEELQLDPFAGARRVNQILAQDVPVQQTSQPAVSFGTGRTPPNPFNKTLHDLEEAKKEEDLQHQQEEEGAALKAGNLAKGALDVDAFRRLLMTGKSDGSSSPLPTKSQIVSDLVGDISSSSASSSPYNGSQENLAASKSSAGIRDGGSALATEVQQDDGSESDSSISVQIGRSKKAPPPPPSSRHGKSIKTETSKETVPTKDLNKPLPSAPASANPEDSDADSPFDKEAAGKVPETDTSLEPTATPRKAVPAPPPPRGHARTDTKTIAPGALSPSRPADDEVRPRSSMESIPPRGDVAPSKANAPAPPPPRRPQAGSRPNSYLPPPHPSTASPALSPSNQSEANTPSVQSPREPPLESHEHRPIAPPPPPPARHGSTRRPGAERRQPAAPESKSREASHGALPPPPPPPRTRGSSKGSIDRPAAAPQSVNAEVPGKGTNILADLDALQREVDAMRGKLG